MLGQPLQRGQGLEHGQGVGDRPAEQGEPGLHDPPPELGRQVVELLRELPRSGAGGERVLGRGRVPGSATAGRSRTTPASGRARPAPARSPECAGAARRARSDSSARAWHACSRPSMNSVIARCDRASAVATPMPSARHSSTAAGEVLLRRGKQAQPVLGHADLEEHEGEMGVRDRVVRRSLHLGQGGVHLPLRVLTTDARAVQQDAVELERRDRPRVRLLVPEKPVGPVPSGVRVACRPPRPGDEPPRGGMLVDRRAGRPEEGVDALVLAGHDQPGTVLGQHRPGVVVAPQDEEAAHGVGGVAAGQVRPRGPQDRRGGALHVDAAGDQSPAHDLAQQRMDAVALLTTRRTGDGGHLAHEQPRGRQ